MPRKREREADQSRAGTARRDEGCGIPGVCVVPVGAITTEKDFGDEILRMVNERVGMALERRKPEYAPRIVLMGQGVWDKWSEEKRIVGLMKAKRIETKTRINGSIEIRLTPGIGDVVVIA